MNLGTALAIAAVVLAQLAGCAAISRPIPPRPEYCWIERDQVGDRVREYPNVKMDQVLDAAERLLRLAGGDHVRFVRSPQTLVAELHREHWFYLYLIAHNSAVWDHWIVATRLAENGVQACVYVRGQFFTDTFVLGAEPVNNVVYPANAIERDPGKLFKPPAHAYPVDYDTFWSRLEYLLGISQVWTPCPSGGSLGVQRNTKRGYPEVNPLCRPLIDDPSPPEPHGR